MGRELLARSFPVAKPGHHRHARVAGPFALSTDRRRRARHDRLLEPVTRSGAPAADRATAGATDLHVEKVASSPAVIEALATIDRAVLGHRRDVDHEWLLAGR